MSTASLIAAMPAATCAISSLVRAAHRRDDAELRGARLRRLLGRLDEHGDVQPRGPDRRLEQARLAAEVAVLGAAAGLQRDDPLDLDLRPAPAHPHLVGELQEGVQRLVRQLQHVEDLLLRQPFTPLEDLVAGDVEDLESGRRHELRSLPSAAQFRGQCVTRETGERGGIEPARALRHRAEERHTRHGREVDEVAARREIGLEQATRRRRRRRSSARDGAARRPSAPCG